jgi:hypothetical protein
LTLNSFTFPVPCADNGGTNGATCNLTSTIDTLYPGSIREFQRANWDIVDPIVATDEGPDGSVDGGDCPGPACGNGDESNFLRQGWFAP